MGMLEKLQIGQWFLILLLLFAVPVSAIYGCGGARCQPKLALRRSAGVRAQGCPPRCNRARGPRPKLDRPQPLRHPPVQAEVVLRAAGHTTRTTHSLFLSAGR